VATTDVFDAYSPLSILRPPTLQRPEALNPTRIRAASLLVPVDEFQNRRSELTLSGRTRKAMQIELALLPTLVAALIRPLLFPSNSAVSRPPNAPTARVGRLMAAAWAKSCPLPLLSRSSERAPLTTTRASGSEASSHICVGISAGVQCAGAGPCAPPAAKNPGIMTTAPSGRSRRRLSGWSSRQ